MGTGVLSRRRRQESEVDLSTSSSVDIKNEWSYTSTPLYAFMERTGIAARLYRLSLYVPYLRYFEGTRLRVFFTELLIHTTAIRSVSQPPYFLYDVSVTSETVRCCDDVIYEEFVRIGITLHDTQLGTKLQSPPYAIKRCTESPLS